MERLLCSVRLTKIRIAGFTNLVAFMIAIEVICTGNFAESNNADGKMTATIEFTDEISKEDILSNLTKIPLRPVYLDHIYNKYTYPIQNSGRAILDRILKMCWNLSGFTSLDVLPIGNIIIWMSLSLPRWIHTKK